MKRTIFNLGLLVAAVLVLASCGGDKAQEERIKELESKIAAMEDQATPSATPASTAAVEEVKPEGPIPAFKFNETFHDFGEINDGDQVEHIFAFTNTGEAPLLIESAKGSCGCTVPQWPKEPIPVGGSGEIVVRFDSKNKPGVQNKTVTITANTFPSVTTLNIKSTVKAAAPAADGPVRQ